MLLRCCATSGGCSWSSTRHACCVRQVCELDHVQNVRSEVVLVRLLHTLCPRAVRCVF
jgi:hypothetical protein